MVVVAAQARKEDTRAQKRAPTVYTGLFCVCVYWREEGRERAGGG